MPVVRVGNPGAIAAVGLVLAGFAVATAQEEIEGKPAGGLAFLNEVEVTVVNIDVFVRDRARRAVTDLTIDDFDVLQARPDADRTLHLRHGLVPAW